MNNRDWALVFWIGALLIWCVANTEIRESLGNLLRAALAWKLLLGFAALIAYVGVEIAAGSFVQLWSPGLLKDTVYWFVGSALVLFMNADKTGDADFFRSTIRRVLAVTLLVEGFISLTAFHLGIELLLVPIAVFLAALGVVAESKSEYASVKGLVDFAMTAIGLGILAGGVWIVVVRWGELDKVDAGLSLVLPIWMTLALVPFIYMLGLVMAYGQVLLRIELSAETPTQRRRAKLAALWGLRGSSRLAWAFAGHWPRSLASAKSAHSARRLLRNFRSQVGGGRRSGKPSLLAELTSANPR